MSMQNMNFKGAVLEVDRGRIWKTPGTLKPPLRLIWGLLGPFGVWWILYGVGLLFTP